MKRFACILLTVSALIIVAAGSGVANGMLPLIVTVGNWGQSEINEDGNLRFRVTASAAGISWIDNPDWEVAHPSEPYPDPDYLQLWAYIEGGPTTNPIDTWVLVKSKAAYDRYARPARSISGTSPRFKLPPGTYSYYLFVVLNDGMSLDPYTILGVSDAHFGGTVTLP